MDGRNIEQTITNNKGGKKELADKLIHITTFQLREI